MPEPMIYFCAECAGEIEPGEEVKAFGLVFCTDECRDEYEAEYGDGE